MKTKETKAAPKTATVKITSPKSKKSITPKTLVKASADASKGVEKHMPDPRNLSEEIAARAYQIWQQQGCPEGREDMHWRQAEREITLNGLNHFVP